MSRRPLLIVGMQKSGTTLFVRLLERSGHAARIDRGEGDMFWGNDPPFSPSAFPAGTLYQQYGGEHGHELDASDASAEVVKTLRTRLSAADSATTDDVPLLFNKSPYNTVRLPWLRAIFPDAFIVAMIRRPVPNVFSLAKKFVPHEGRGLAPEMGWWGVKPAGWRTMRDASPLVQSARQWRAVNARLLAHRALVDTVVHYDELCADPDGILHAILERATGAQVHLSQPSPPLHCADDEVERGGRLKSRNRAFREEGSLSADPLPDTLTQLPPLGSADVQHITEICQDVARALELSA